MTIELASEQALGVVYGSDNGPVSIYYGTDDMIAVGWGGLSSAMLAESASHKIVGTIEADGTIKIDRFALVLTDYVWGWDVFNTTWAKQ
jgi:hypothetical protein